MDNKNPAREAFKSADMNSLTLVVSQDGSHAVLSDAEAVTAPSGASTTIEIKQEAGTEDLPVVDSLEAHRAPRQQQSSESSNIPGLSSNSTAAPETSDVRLAWANFNRHIERENQMEDTQDDGTQVVTSNSIPETLKSSCSTNEHRIQRLEEQLQIETRESSGLREGIEKLRAENSNLEQLILESASKYGHQSIKMTALKEGSDHFENLYHAERRKQQSHESEITRLKETLTIKQDELQRWRTMTAEAQSQFDSYWKRTQEQQAQNRKAMQDCLDEGIRMKEEYKTRLHGRKIELDALQSDLNETQHKLAQAKNKLRALQNTPRTESAGSIILPTRDRSILDGELEYQDNNVNVNWDEHGSNAHESIEDPRPLSSLSSNMSRNTARRVMSVAETPSGVAASHTEEKQTTFIVRSRQVTPTFSRSFAAPKRGPGAMKTCDASRSISKNTLPASGSSRKPYVRDARVVGSLAINDEVAPTRKRKRSTDDKESNSSQQINDEQCQLLTRGRTDLRLIENDTVPTKPQQGSLPAIMLDSSATMTDEAGSALQAAKSYQAGILREPTGSVDASPAGTPLPLETTGGLESTCTIKLTDLFSSDVDLEPPMNKFQDMLRSQIARDFKEYLLQGPPGGRSGMLDKCCLMRFKKRPTIETQFRTVCSVCERLRLFCLRMGTTKTDRVTVVSLNETIRSGRKDEIGYWVRH